MGSNKTTRAKQRDSHARQRPCFKTFSRVYRTYCVCESLAVLFLMSFKKFLLRRNKKNVGYSWKQNEFRAEKLVIRHLKVLSIELPSTVCIPGSRRTQGTSPRIFQQQSVETQQRVKTSPPLPSPPYPKYHSQIW